MLLRRHGPVLNKRDKPKKADGVPEDNVLRAARHHAKANGWLFYHTFDSRGSEKGYLDVTATNGVRICIAELKRTDGKLTEEQVQWYELLRHTGLIDVFIWRPADIAETIPAYFEGRYQG